MKAGRKNLQRACQDGSAVTLAEGESIMQVVTLRGSNLIEVTDGEGVKSLALFPAKFQKSFWIKNGNFVVVDASGRDEALESGSKIGCVVSRVLFHEQVRALEKSGRSTCTSEKGRSGRVGRAWAALCVRQCRATGAGVARVHAAPPPGALHYRALGPVRPRWHACRAETYGVAQTIATPCLQARHARVISAK
ncbi:uncharacterized protein [Lolium perenne]|uniref:uncharacterized protein n=1 Tax=Lolium perenne TaxID=4522 RepID=UPI0021EB428A|nr:uncharacterized protein LOC127297519 [Lolium perenne]